ncbi:MAG: multiheme c-type cytochrome [Verrucomicrobiota bacterium]
MPLTACRNWRIPKRTKALLLVNVAGLLLVTSFAANAQNVPHLSIALPGGMPGLPVVTGVARASNGLSITWDGPSGYYQLFEKPSLRASKWQAVGKDTNLNRQATVNVPLSNAFFIVSGPSPQYDGAAACADCHASIVDTVAQTPHSKALTNALFVADGGATNDRCLVCHTVGLGLPTGFVNETKTPKLGGVQCENCHGPAAGHPANPGDVTALPQVELAATVCGGCHTRARHPTFDEWQSSAHARVVAGLNATNQINSCGRCHSGSVRYSLIVGATLPTGDADVGIVCATCHDPHQTNDYPAQLRYPVASTNDYFMSTNGTFASQYNPAINVCGQCHNDTGASWTNTLSAPHPSSQYNMLLGTVGELGTGLAPYQPGSHALLITNQCAGCHMQTSSYVSQAVPANTGHSFRVESYALCLQCHPVEPQLLAQDWQAAVSDQIQEVKFGLDYWAANSTNAAVKALWTKYGDLAWEYSTPGQLSVGGPGPDAAEQAQIPVNIQKARFNMYVVLSDGSLGVHNALYAVDLLDAAENWVEDEIGQ